MRSIRLRLEVLMALLWSRPARRDSACPDDNLLAALFDGSLPEEQARTVREHVADCPDCYTDLANWVETEDLVPIEQIAPTRTAAPRSAWRGASLAVLGSAAAVGLTVTVLLGVLPNEPNWVNDIDRQYDGLVNSINTYDAAPDPARWTWRTGGSARSAFAEGRLDAAGLAVNDAARSALATGIVQALGQVTAQSGAWLEIRTELAEVSTICPGELTRERCEQIAALFVPVGRWLLTMHFACDAQHSGGTTRRLAPATTMPWADHDFWQANAELLPTIATQINTTVPTDPYSKIFSRWASQSASGDVARFCSGVDGVINTALQ
jgi:hypothetical protein